MTSKALDYEYPEFYDSAAVEGGDAISYPKYYNDAALIGGFTTAKTTLRNMFGEKKFKKGEVPKGLTNDVIKKATDIFDHLRPADQSKALKIAKNKNACIEALAIVYLMESLSKQRLYYKARNNDKMLKTITNRKLALGRYIHARGLSDVYKAMQRFFVPHSSAPHSLPNKVRGIAALFERGRFNRSESAYRHKTSERNVNVLREILNTRAGKPRYSKASLLEYLEKSGNPELIEYKDLIEANRKLKRNMATKARRELNKHATSSKSPRKSIAGKAPRKGLFARKTTGGKVLLLDRTPYSYFQ